jgi:enoyl-CoA hydratase/carnithine racemase
VRVVVLRGAGDRAFISGADIGQLDSGDISRPRPRSEQVGDNAGMGAFTVSELAKWKKLIQAAGIQPE